MIPRFFFLISFFQPRATGHMLLTAGDRRNIVTSMYEYAQLLPKLFRVLRGVVVLWCCVVV